MWHFRWIHIFELVKNGIHVITSDSEVIWLKRPDFLSINLISGPAPVPFPRRFFSDGVSHIDSVSTYGTFFMIPSRAKTLFPHCLSHKNFQSKYDMLSQHGLWFIDTPENL